MLILKLGVVKLSNLNDLFSKYNKIERIIVFRKEGMSVLRLELSFDERPEGFLECTGNIETNLI